MQDLYLTWQPYLSRCESFTHKNEVFKWGQAEQNPFDQLKTCLANAEILDYYDKNA